MTAWGPHRPIRQSNLYHDNLLNFKFNSFLILKEIKSALKNLKI